MAVCTVLGYPALLLVLAACFFCAAVTLAFWQAWVYLLAFGGSTTRITLALSSKPEPGSTSAH